ncbi:MAG: hypothetical protein MI919_09815, partial [Holophagales bacterium]|nr:hypothetical protein [Holophagales bacterium]
LGVFDTAAENWKTFGPRTRQVIDLRRGRATVVGSGIDDSLSIPADWGERIGGGPLWYRTEPEHFSSPGRTWAIEARGDQIRAWALAASPAGLLAFQIDRRVTPLPSSGPRLGRIVLPDRPLSQLTTRELRDLACWGVGSNLRREAWRRLIGDEPWRPTCQPPRRDSSAGSSEEGSLERGGSFLPQ